MRLTKRILVFIGLKLLEIGGVAVGAVGLFWVGRVGERVVTGKSPQIDGAFDYVFYAWVGFFGVFIVFWLLLGLEFLIKANWEKAGKIAGDK